MIVAAIALAALLGLAGLTLLSVRGGIRASGHERRQAIALFAAESGISAGMDFLRKNRDASANWGAYVTANNSAPSQPSGVPGAGIKSGVTGNLFSADQGAWYEITILNNVSDPGFSAGTDADAHVVIRSVGHGPNNASVTLEVGIRGPGATALGRPCPVYAQRGIAEDGAGRNDCLSVIDGSTSATFRPGGGP